MIAMRAWASGEYERSDDVILTLFSNLTGIPTSESVVHAPLLSSAGLHCYQLALKACARQGKLETALSIIDAMLAHGPSPDVRCFNFCIEAFTESAIQSNRLEEYVVGDILPLLEEMKQHKVQPNVVTINVMMRALTLISGAQSAMHLYREHFEHLDIKGTEASLREASLTEFELTPDLYTFTSLLWDITLKTNKVSTAAVNTNYLLNQAVEAAIEPDELFIVAALHALVRSEQYSEALYLFRSVLVYKKFGAVKAFDTLKCHDFEDTQVLAKLVSKSQWSDILNNVKFWNIAIEAASWTHRGGFLALKILKVMNSMSGPQPDEQTIAMCVYACCDQAKDIDMTDAMRDKSLRKSISLLHDFLLSPQCEDANYLSRALTALNRAVTNEHHSPLLWLFRKDVEQLYFSHSSHHHNQKSGIFRD